jgi:RNA polymerase sigma-70 factor (ECF subfamily)
VTARPFGDEELIAELPGLRRYARMLTSRPEDAEDLLQDTLERALAHRESFRGDASLRTWLHRTMHHRRIDLLRRERTDPTPDDELLARVDAAWRADAYTVPADEVIGRAGVADDLRDALVHLPVILRSAVVLHDMEGMTMAEVAAVQGVRLPAAKQRLRRGRAALVSLLDGDTERRAALDGVPLRCWKARSLIGDYLAGELETPRARAVEAHLGACPTCPGLYAAIVGVRDAVGRLRDPDSVVDGALADELRERLRHYAR